MIFLRRVGYIGLVTIFLSVGCSHTQAWFEDPSGFCDSFEYTAAEELVSDGTFTIGGFKPLLLDLVVNTSEYGSMSFVEIRIKTLGAQPGAEMNYEDPTNGHIYVCAGDCLYVDETFYSSQTTIKTDDDGIANYTISAGAAVSGFVLEDWGNATCVHYIAPYVQEEEAS